MRALTHVLSFSLYRMFNHIAHLGGAFFGVVYYEYGRQFFQWLRIQLGALPKHAARPPQA